MCFISFFRRAEVYRPKTQGNDEEEDGALLSVSATCNTLNLVLRGPGTMKFVKFVSAAAPGSRWDIALEYKCRVPDDDEEQEDEENV